MQEQNQSAQALEGQSSFTSENSRTVPGLWLILGVVVLGMVPTSLYFHWKVPGVIEDFRELVRNSPKDPASKLGLWFEMNQPQVHNRLSQFRISAKQPWLVAFCTPADQANVEPGEIVAGVTSAEEPKLEGQVDQPDKSVNWRNELEAWGLDFEHLPIEAVTQEGLEVRVTLPAPRSLGVHRLVGNNVHRVPVYNNLEEAPESSERVLDMLEYALRHPDDFLEAFEKDNPGTSFYLTVGENSRRVAHSEYVSEEDESGGTDS